MVRREVRLHQRLCVPETFANSEHVVERILNPTGQKLHLKQPANTVLFWAHFGSTVALSIL